MKKINFWSLGVLLLGIGIGIIVSVGIFYYNPLVEYKEYSDSQIVEKYTEIMLKKQREKEKNESNIEKEETSNNQSIKEDKKKGEVKFIIDKGESLDKVIDDLYESKIIDDKRSFLKRLKVREATGKIQYGTYEIKLPIAYDDLIDKILVK